MGDHSERLKARNNGKEPYVIDDVVDFQRELNTLMGRLRGDMTLYFGVSAVLNRAQHNAQSTMDAIQAQADEEARALGEQDGKPAAPEYPH